MMLLNTRSIVNKIAATAEICNEHSLDIFAITESWLVQNDPVIDILLSDIPEYSMLHVPRLGRRGGGVGILYKSFHSCTYQERGRNCIYNLQLITIK